jgi:V-type H+-transporting ATPase proteolipid subunit
VEGGADGGQCVRAYVYEGRVFVSMVLILIFAEVLGLYGCVAPLSVGQTLTPRRLIVALIMNSAVGGMNESCQ